MTLADIRSRLAGLEGRKYWRSLEELADTPEFRSYLGREFPSQASEFTDPAGRREFLKLMGASLALAGVSSCTRIPDEKIIPYVRQPEEIIPGRPLFFATAMPQGGFGMPVLAENHMGRPTKIEGNPEHPASLGATDVFGQASVLSLYDPDRSRNVLDRGEVGTWGAFLAAIQAAVGSQRALRGQGLRFLSEPITSPSIADQMQQLMAALPDAKWHQWDPVFGVVQGGAPASTPLYRFDKADVVVSLDADFLGVGQASLRYTKDFSSRRRVGTPQDELSRLYVVEPVPSITGAKAEHRLPMKARDIHGFASALASALGAAPQGNATLPAEAAKWVEAIAADLQAHRGRSIVIAGLRQPAAVHTLAQQMNDILGNGGTTVSYIAPLVATPTDGVASLTELVGDMNAHKVDALVIFGGNPVFNAPADLNFAKALENVPTRFHLGLYNDETAEHCHWHAPEAHYLESWGDVRAFDGTVSLIQPLIAPIYDGHQMIELLAAMNGAASRTPVDVVKDYWTRAFGHQTKATWAIHDHEGKPFPAFTDFWRHALHDGYLPGTSMMGVGGAPTPAAAAAVTAPAASGMEIVFAADPTILDGRYANNAWLQELPKPLSKVTWDNVAYIGVATAEKLGIAINRPGNQDNDLLEITYHGRTAQLPVWVMPGTADDVVVVHFGYGRRKAGRVGTNVGHDVFGLRGTEAPWFGSGAQVIRTGTGYLVTSTQNHFAMEGRNLVRVVDAEEYKANPKSVAELGPEKPSDSLSLFPPREYKGNKWGMAIDLNSCTGCGVCVAACVSENNIPVVGKTQVYRQREMHWIRVDTYFEGNPEQPKTYNQPVPCQQCEDAPCELVCPVAATSHNDEGLNDMVYNRCVGTRYCSNNCPYKVRRFNFLLYSDFTTPELFAVRNPDVTVRSRGVMEKCTYCVQRINHARIDAKVGDHAIKDGDVKTACQQACPADAITFGNLNDPDSKVSRAVKQDRNYGLLEDLGTRPRTSYLAVVRNPNPALEAKAPAAKGE